MAIEVFNRYEKKYMLDAETYKTVAARLADYMEPDAYCRRQAATPDETGGRAYTIRNIYFDTEDDQIIRHSLEKPLYKENLRMRSYGGGVDPEGKVFLEIKKKANGLVNKRRTKMTLRDAERFVRDGHIELRKGMNGQVVREIEYLFARRPLKAAVYLAYDRRAWFSKDDHDLRISFDTGIRTRRTQLSLAARDYGRPLIEDGRYLMEIKTAHSMPLWLCKILSEQRVYPCSFSKYGTEYKRHFQYIS
jgi:hypothetical protein